MQLVDALY
jgi:hypothetical protein